MQAEKAKDRIFSGEGEPVGRTVDWEIRPLWQGW